MAGQAVHIIPALVVSMRFWACDTFIKSRIVVVVFVVYRHSDWIIQSGAIWNLNTKHKVNTHKNRAVASAFRNIAYRSFNFSFVYLCVCHLRCGYTRCKLFHNREDQTLIWSFMLFFSSPPQPSQMSCPSQLFFVHQKSIGENCLFRFKEVRALALATMYRHTWRGRPCSVEVESIWKRVWGIRLPHESFK